MSKNLPKFSDEEVHLIDRFFWEMELAERHAGRCMDSEEDRMEVATWIVDEIGVARMNAQKSNDELERLRAENAELKSAVNDARCKFESLLDGLDYWKTIS
jgi:hypothetical protein